MGNQKMDVKQARSDRDAFLFCILQDPEFIAIRDKHLGNQLMLFHRAIPQSLDRQSKLALYNCIKELSQKFKLPAEMIKDLILSDKHILAMDLGHIPKVFIEDGSVMVQLGATTTKQDVDSAWPTIVEKQKELSGQKKRRSRTSNTPILAYCVHKQVISGKTIAQVFDEYINERLYGYNLKPTITDYNDFRKYYNRIVKGI